MTDVSAGFRPPCWCSSRWAAAWRPHTNLYEFGENVSLHIFHKKNCCDLNRGESLCISTFFLFSDSRLNLYDRFLIFLFWFILNGMTLKTSNSTARLRRRSPIKIWLSRVTSLPFMQCTPSGYCSLKSPVRCATSRPHEFQGGIAKRAKRSARF